jgi:hypothetical protein
MLWSQRGQVGGGEVLRPLMSVSEAGVVHKYLGLVHGDEVTVAQGEEDAAQNHYSSLHGC